MAVSLEVKVMPFVTCPAKRLSCNFSTITCCLAALPLRTNCGGSIFIGSEASDAATDKKQPPQISKIRKQVILMRTLFMRTKKAP